MPDKLEALLKKNNIVYERIIFEESVKDSKSSSTASNLELNKIVKTVLFKNKQKQVISVIIRSTEKVDKSKVKEALNSSKLELIQFDSVINYVNYPAGGVPPFGYNAVFVMDSDLKDEELVLVGGGTIYSLIKIRIKDIKKLSKPLIVDVKQQNL
jgi:Cys-tRNA(Pro)/Cys-tRNA(Cys) deacylase